MIFTSRSKKIQKLEERYRQLSKEAFNLSLNGEEKKSQKINSQAQLIKKKLLAYNI